MLTLPKRFERKKKMERLMKKVAVMDNGCWQWLGYRDKSGYGQASLAGTLTSAHQAFFLLSGKIIPVGKEIDHICRIRSCVNPQHLRAVTHAENMAARPRKTHCINGHELAPQNTYINKKTNGKVCRICRDRHVKEWHARNNNREIGISDVKLIDVSFGNLPGPGLPVPEIPAAIEC